MNRNDQQFMVQEIRAQYVEKKSTELDRLRALDAKVKRPVAVLAYVLGIVAALIMGAGMSLIMTDIGAIVGINATVLLGVIGGIVGLLMALANYPIYRSLLRARRAKYSQDILALSDQIINQIN